MKSLVTGGGGFLGGAIVEMLLSRGDAVRIFGRSDAPKLRGRGVEFMRGDLANEAQVQNACRDCDIVFHAAAKAGLWGAAAEYYKTNVVGTNNIIKACRDKGVTRLVFTSSPSVVFNGEDLQGVDESTPYARRFISSYAKTKALAEQAVLAANGSLLATVALRPHLIWGPGDNHLIPRILERSRLGQLRQIGEGVNRVDTTYIDNAALAHLLAGDRLAPAAPIAGKAYFISNGEPLPLWELINRILAAAGQAPVIRRTSFYVAYASGWILEMMHRVFGRAGEPRMTRFLANELSTAHWFDLTAARRDLAYVPVVSIDEGLRRLGAWFAGSEIIETRQMARC